MRKIKATFITTVFNEELEIVSFIDSILIQTLLPDELVVVDGGSTDKTVDKINSLVHKIESKKIRFKLFVKKGNRSVGRNEAIKKSRNNIILCSDAGNILDKNWIKNISTPFEDKNVDVVAGFYKGLAKNIFQKCLIPYVLVMPDQVNPDEFLPATRSVAFRKSIWKKIGGFDEKFSHNEDYVFAKKLKKDGAKIFFAKNAIARWIPRSNVRQSFVMFFRFAYGDVQAGILRGKVVLLFMRIILLLALLALFLKSFNRLYMYLILILICLYYIWIVHKSYKYVGDVKGFIILPFVQLIADAAVFSGSTISFLRNSAI